MTFLASLASRIYQVPEVHELTGFLYWIATGNFLR
jgi:hypothetical protein